MPVDYLYTIFFCEVFTSFGGWVFLKLLTLTTFLKLDQFIIFLLAIDENASDILVSFHALMLMVAQQWKNGNTVFLGTLD